VQRLLPLVLALVLLGGAQLAHADGGATITIAPSDGGAERTLALADLTGSFDVHGVAYTVRAADGGQSTTTVADGISLNALLAAAALDADAFDYIAIAKADGTVAIVMRDDLGGGGDDDGPPVLWTDAAGIHFLRPSSGDGDANGADLVTLADGAPLAIVLKTGEPLVPRIAVSTLRARPRERIDFSASLVGGAPLGPGLDYQWYFDGTGRVRGANVSHRFRGPGTYHVLLNVVRGDGSSVGAPDTADVHVVPARQRRSDDARRSDESQQDAGATVGSGRGGAETGSGGTGTGGGAGSPASAPVPYAPPVAAPPTAAAPPPAPAPVRRQAPAPRRRTPGELVSGTLLASTSAAAVPVDAAPAASAAARGAAADGPLNVPVGVWVTIGLVVLVALGWALESRHTLPFWQP
jgi:PKD domain